MYYTLPLPRAPHRTLRRRIQEMHRISPLIMRARLLSLRTSLHTQHNDYQRHMMYLWLMPLFEAGKLRKWGSGQVLPAGYIRE